jgi:hypothetical protein
MVLVTILINSPNATLRVFIKKICTKNRQKKLTQFFFFFFRKKSVKLFFNIFLAIGVQQPIWGIPAKIWGVSRPAGLGGDRDCTDRK